jgi:hypothetical protein
MMRPSRRIRQGRRSQIEEVRGVDQEGVVGREDAVEEEVVEEVVVVEEAFKKLLTW